jgi:site-specific recombinase XerD
MKDATVKENNMDLTSFQTYLSINVGKKATNNYMNQMKGFFLHFQEFNQESVNNYLASKVNTWSSGSFNCFFKAVIWYMKFTKVMVELPEMKKVEKKPRKYLDEKVIEDILSKTAIMFKDGQKVRIILELLFVSGMRPDELYNLKRENVNLTDSKISLVNTKTKLSRVVFISSDLANNIKSYFNTEPEKENAFNLCEQSLSYYCRMISQYMNIKITPYMLRHSFAHDFLKKSGNNLIGLANLLGHGSIETTRIYSDIDEKELEEIYRKAYSKRRKK